jgi:hypothetical protein
MSMLLTGRGRDELVFTAPDGGPVSEQNFRNRGLVPGHRGSQNQALPAARDASHRR